MAAPSTVAQSWSWGSQIAVKQNVTISILIFERIFGITLPCLIASPLVYLNELCILEGKIIKTKLPSQSKIQQIMCTTKPRLCEHNQGGHTS